jgi:hypothetical protein|tara:strand:+ start:3263 stop:3766 length:504 start_codon:yes stop_codon:yes gene_type:complete
LTDEIEVPNILKRLADHNAEHGTYVSAKYEQKFIRQREDGTKVYMFRIVDEAHRIMPDGKKVYDNEGKRKWIMPASTPRKPKRRDIARVIDLEIFKAMSSLKHAKKRVVIATVREALTTCEHKEHLPKNVGVAISRRISSLLDSRHIEIEQQTKSRKVLVKGKYKYV